MVIGTRLLVATGLVLGALLSAHNASASPTEDALFAALSAAGIPIASREEAVAAGELACDSATSGIARDVVAQKVSDKTGLDVDQANTFVGIAQAVYCPFQPQLG
jgi:hypothetical protein